MTKYQMRILLCTHTQPRSIYMLAVAVFGAFLNRQLMVAKMVYMDLRIRIKSAQSHNYR